MKADIEQSTQKGALHKDNLKHYLGRIKKSGRETDWRNVEEFVCWALEAGYAYGKRLVLIDPNGPYSMGNCEWRETEKTYYTERKLEMVAKQWDDFIIPKKLMPPTRLVRYCCSVLKEKGGAGRFICTGVRWAESESRKKNRGIYEKIGSTKANKIVLNNDNDDKRMLFENCGLQAKRVVNPIVDWSDDDVWNFLGVATNVMCGAYNITECGTHINPLYDEGWCRVGCVGCPMAGKKGVNGSFFRTR